LNEFSVIASRSFWRRSNPPDQTWRIAAICDCFVVKASDEYIRARNDAFKVWLTYTEISILLDLRLQPGATPAKASNPKAQKNE